jgi:hypothetical protein
MNIFLVMLLAAAMAATVYVLIRGIMTMAGGKPLSSVQLLVRLRKRVQFLALAIIIVVIILLAAGTARG